jgi:hypothetical protein
VTSAARMTSASRLEVAEAFRRTVQGGVVVLNVSSGGRCPLSVIRPGVSYSLWWRLGLLPSRAAVAALLVLGVLFLPFASEPGGSQVLLSWLRSEWQKRLATVISPINGNGSSEPLAKRPASLWTLLAPGMTESCNQVLA